eukprot:CAMPEP_0174758438 /NCGR_PEP_ID=MMETSP1094-20130205/107766_1 /TAXON_ID=156173 /ORGANISM="Chrysochromulina brevifilum, Strain UTEX LB 985" /LENGTH=84 /DNA_ID=CAMNT_0015964367 /DNA_START=77 /DNA_END=331 /DNA_ORIENTATION=-
MCATPVSHSMHVPSPAAQKAKSLRSMVHGPWSAGSIACAMLAATDPKLRQAAPPPSLLSAKVPGATVQGGALDTYAYMTTCIHV